MNLQKVRRAEDPEKYAWPPLSPANISWRSMFVCALIEAAVLGELWWYNRPCPSPARPRLVFSYGLLFGLATVAFKLRLKGLRQPRRSCPCPSCSPWLSARCCCGRRVGRGRSRPVCCWPREFCANWRETSLAKGIAANSGPFGCSCARPHRIPKGRGQPSDST